VLRIATWNINHRAGKGPLKRAEPISDAIDALNADIVVLTEYMRQLNREEILPLLVERGWKHHIVTPLAPGRNSLLIVSKLEIEKGKIEVPLIDIFASPSALHVVVPEYEMNVLGIRIPDYRKPEYRRIRAEYWDWFMSMAQDALDEPFVIIGDMNTDPLYPSKDYGDRLLHMAQAGWRHALPETGWSYKGNSTKEGREKRLDHAFVTQHFELISAEYVQRLGMHVFAGDKDRQLSDHAPLVIEIRKKDATQPE